MTRIVLLFVLSLDLHCEPPPPVANDPHAGCTYDGCNWQCGSSMTTRACGPGLSITGATGNDP